MLEAFPDYYGILGIPRHTREDGIRRAYLRGAWRYHPDLHPDDPSAAATMTHINIAYATLSDPVRRAEYDANRVRIRLQVHTPRTRTGSSSGLRRGHHVGNHARERAGVFDSTLALIARLIRYVTTVLPS